MGAASSIPALVMARGHCVNGVEEIPVVVSDDVQAFQRTKEALALLKALGLDDDLAHVNNSKKLRKGKGKMRNRRYVQRKGPLVICQNERLNLLTLAPGGHVGRLCIWPESAFKQLDAIFGTFDTASKIKGGFKVPQHIMADADLARVINSDEIQSVINAPKENKMKYVLKRNPLRNRGTMLKLNPYHSVVAAKRKADGKITAAKKAKYATSKKMKAQKAKV